MKYSTAFFLAFLIICVFQPDESKGQLSLGVKAGVSAGLPGFSKYYKSVYLDEFDLSVRPGFTAGLVADTKVGSIFSLQKELSYTFRSTSLKREGGDFVKNSMKMHFIDLPILLKTRLNEGYQKYYVTFGPTISYWLGGNMNIEANELDEWDIKSISRSMSFKQTNPGDEKIYIPNANRLQFALSIGAGMESDLRNGQKIMFDLRYDIGHTYFSDQREVDTGLVSYQANMETNNQFLSFSVIFVYDLETFRRNMAR